MQILRAEDLQVFDSGIDLGGRSVLAGSIVSVQVQKRVSAELLRFAGLIVVGAVVVVLSRPWGAAVGVSCLSSRSSYWERQGSSRTATSWSWKSPSWARSKSAASPAKLSPKLSRPSKP